MTAILVNLSLLLLLPHVMSGEKVYHNQFAVEVEGGKEAADQLAERHGLVNTGQIGALEGHFLLESHKIEKRSAEPCATTHGLLASDPEVKWFEQQTELGRSKRGRSDL
eukprot:GFUD01011728.1.p2 GENE.GFUD01011728.1~~GFUD01011728.1.p2  ORF type:complete len:109 (+),score=43.49 GFUD01011728.1:157-483(+)